VLIKRTHAGTSPAWLGGRERAAQTLHRHYQPTLPAASWKERQQEEVTRSSEQLTHPRDLGKNLEQVAYVQKDPTWERD
jgi:hypothetical protein